MILALSIFFWILYFNFKLIFKFKFLTLYLIYIYNISLKFLSRVKHTSRHMRINSLNCYRISDSVNHLIENCLKFFCGEGHCPRYYTTGPIFENLMKNLRKTYEKSDLRKLTMSM